MNSIEISNLKNLNYGQNFEKLMRNFRRGDDYFLESSYVYDMTEYFHKIEKRKIQQGLGSDERRVSEAEPLRISFENIKNNKFAGKVIMSFSYLSIVKEIINVFQAGLLAEKLKSDIDNGIHDESMTNEETDVIKMVLANEDFFNRVEVKMA